MNQQALEALLADLRGTPLPKPPSPAVSELAPTLPTQEQLDLLLTSLTNSPPPSHRDIASLSFPESLPYLQALSVNDEFLEALADLKAEQADEELRLRDERNRLENEGTRSGMAPHVQARTLMEWDRKALVRWKQLQERQCVRLQEMGVPTFQPTSDPIVLKRQERVMAVLVGFLD